jgi:RNA-directed DNA polymerase
VAAFEHKLEDNVHRLRTRLRARRYQPEPYISFYIHEPKRRLISAAAFKDRVVHHALCNVIEPIFERSFMADSYANRKGKGTHRALDCAQAYARRFRYVLQLDIRQYFSSIDHDVLRAALARKITDAQVMWLIDLILESGAEVHKNEYEMVYFPGDDLLAVERSRGLPIGNLTSQFWANVYLNSLDHFIKRQLRAPGYVRYVDDLLLFSNDKSHLWEWRQAIEQRLIALRLTFHPGAHPRPIGEGIPFLGFLIFPHKRCLKRRKGVRFQQKLRALLDEWEAGFVSDESLSASIQGWINHVRYGNTVGLRKSVLAAVPEEIIALITVSDHVLA